MNFAIATGGVDSSDSAYQCICEGWVVWKKRVLINHLLNL